MKDKLQKFMELINSKIASVGIDKVLHFFVGAWITAECKVFGDPLILGLSLLFVILIGYIKEKVMDKEFDFADMWFGAAGSIISIFLYVPYHEFFT